ncbi:MAG: hypothetical protein HYT37_04485 [Candidatus Sungbacteria bacterium]|nr:hypothetical protein [Candidatus Sungbacteria bacterium]
MVKEGFDQTATKEELKTIATKEELKSIEKKMDVNLASIISHLNQMQSDHSDLPDIREDLLDHDERITRLERKKAIAK